MPRTDVVTEAQQRELSEVLNQYRNVPCFAVLNTIISNALLNKLTLVKLHAAINLALYNAFENYSYFERLIKNARSRHNQLAEALELVMKQQLSIADTIHQSIPR